MTPHCSGFSPPSCPLLCHSHPSAPWQRRPPWHRAQAAGSFSARTLPPRRSLRAPQGPAGTPRGWGGSRKTSGSQRQPEDAKEEGRHLTSPRASPGTWVATGGGTEKPEPPGGASEHPEEMEHPESSTGEPGGDEVARRAPGETLEDPEEMRQVQRGTQGDVAPRGDGVLGPLRAGQRCPVRCIEGVSPIWVSSWGRGCRRKPWPRPTAAPPLPGHRQCPAAP